MKKISLILLIIFCISCSQNNKKNWLTYGTGVGTGMAGYTLTKSLLGTSGSGGNINQVIAITTLSTLLGVFMGSEIADNIYQDEQEILNVSLESDKRTAWSMVDQNKKEILTRIEPKEEIIRDFGKNQCKKFEFSIEESGYIKRGNGYACLNNKTGNWEMLGVEML